MGLPDGVGGGSQRSLSTVPHEDVDARAARLTITLIRDFPRFPADAEPIYPLLKLRDSPDVRCIGNR
jgi:hypothetical protein